MEQHTYEELHKKSVAELRDIASKIENEALSGFTGMHKEQLLPILCKVLGIEGHTHHEVVGVDKKSLKARIRILKKERVSAIESRDARKLEEIRIRIHNLKRRLRKSTV